MQQCPPNWGCKLADSPHSILTASRQLVFSWLGTTASCVRKRPRVFANPHLRLRWPFAILHMFAGGELWGIDELAHDLSHGLWGNDELAHDLSYVRKSTTTSAPDPGRSLTLTSGSSGPSLPPGSWSSGEGGVKFPRRATELPFPEEEVGVSPRSVSVLALGDDSRSAG